MKRRWIPEWAPCWLNNALCDVDDAIQSGEPLRTVAAVWLLIVFGALATLPFICIVYGVLWLLREIGVIT